MDIFFPRFYPMAVVMPILIWSCPLTPPLLGSQGAEEGVCTHQVPRASQSKGPGLCPSSESPHRLGAHDRHALLHRAGLPTPEGHMVRTFHALVLHRPPGIKSFQFPVGVRLKEKKQRSGHSGEHCHLNSLSLRGEEQKVPQFKLIFDCILLFWIVGVIAWVFFLMTKSYVHLRHPADNSKEPLEFFCQYRKLR